MNHSLTSLYLIHTLKLTNYTTLQNSVNSRISLSSPEGLMPPDLCHSCKRVSLRRQRWQHLQMALTAVTKQNWMHRVSCQTIIFGADLWNRSNCHSDCLCTYRHICHLVPWRLIKDSYVAVTVAYFLFLHNRAGCEGGKCTSSSFPGEEGLTSGISFTAEYISLYFCPPVVPVHLRCEVTVCSGLGQRLVTIHSCGWEDYRALE